MTERFTRIGLGVGTAIMTLGVAAGLYATAQNPDPNGVPPLRGGRHMGPPRMEPRMGPWSRPLGPFGPLPMIASQLELSDAQKDQLKAVVKSYRDEWRAVWDKAATARRALMAASAADQIDEPTIRQRAADVGVAEGDLAVGRASVYVKVLQLLTPDQQAKLKDMGARMQRWRQRAHRRGRQQQ